uniref:Ig-like domain-containing protein n=1 Tax=Ornithorhynchus anatinus TaxID=9258 RepID=F7C2I7_ORNAN
MASFPEASVSGSPSFLSISFVTAQFSVIGPVKPILVLVGEDAKLPCHLEPKTSAKDMEVRWFRTHASNVVHLCQNGTDHLGEQLEGYRGRTELLRDAIANGSLAVRIHKVRASDDGQYCCSFQHGSVYKWTTLELQVTTLGSDPHIRMEWYKGGGIWMECTSAGWYPEPVVRWRDARGQTVPALSESRPRARDGLYGVAVSLVVRDDSVGMVSCSIWNPRLGQEKKSSISITAQFSVIGPDKPILALVGGDAELSCHLNPKRSAEHMEIKWLQSQSLNIIHLYDNGQDNNNVQMDKYQGRTELVRNDIKEGRLALRISEVRATDDGQYLCIFNEGPLSEETTLELQVAEMGSDPHIRLVGHEDGRIRLECSSAGWYPEPQVLWRDAREETFPSLSKALSQTADGLFGVAASVIIQEGSMGTVSCSVQNSCLSREKISAFISISG